MIWCRSTDITTETLLWQHWCVWWKVQQLLVALCDSVLNESLCRKAKSVCQSFETMFSFVQKVSFMVKVCFFLFNTVREWNWKIVKHYILLTVSRTKPKNMFSWTTVWCELPTYYITSSTEHHHTALFSIHSLLCEFSQKKKKSKAEST